MRIRELGIRPGRLPAGPENAITDVPGVRVGQATFWRDAPYVQRSGATVIWPHEDDPYVQPVYAASHVLNGYGIMTGRAAIDERGLLASPIVLCNTRSVGYGYEAVLRHYRRTAAGDLPLPVVAECDDGYLNDNRGDAVPIELFEAALQSARGGPVIEGAVGAGTGMHLFGFKGGIGTASRVVLLDGQRYVLGVLLNTNFGRRQQMVLRGRYYGDAQPRLPDEPAGVSEGSCIGVVATDAPLLPHQLKRVAQRIGLGLARAGSVGNDGSGELFLAFSTAQKINPSRRPTSVASVEGTVGPSEPSPLNMIFEATVEATEEAVLNALLQATTTTGRDGHVLSAFPAGMLSGAPG